MSLEPHELTIMAGLASGLKLKSDVLMMDPTNVKATMEFVSEGLKYPEGKILQFPINDCTTYTPFRQVEYVIFQYESADEEEETSGRDTEET